MEGGALMDRVPTYDLVTEGTVVRRAAVCRVMGGSYVRVDDISEAINAVLNPAGVEIGRRTPLDPEARLALALERVETLTRCLVGEREQRMRERHAEPASAV